MIALSVEELALERGARRLFEGLSFAVAAGEAAALVGANGAGKTSILRAVAGLLRPASGRIAFADARGPLAAEIAREDRLHLLGHHDGLKPSRRAGDELAFWARWLGGGVDDLAMASSAFDLASLLDLEVRRLSAGQRRRLALARLLAAPRALWLLDEPLAPLDVEHRARFAAAARTHLDGGGMILAAVHDALPITARTIEVSALVPVRAAAVR